MTPYWRRAAPILDHRAGLRRLPGAVRPRVPVSPGADDGADAVRREVRARAAGLGGDRRAARSSDRRARGQRRTVGADRADAGAARRRHDTPRRDPGAAGGDRRRRAGQRAAADAAARRRRGQRRQRERGGRPLPDGAPAVHAGGRGGHRCGAGSPVAGRQRRRRDARPRRRTGPGRGAWPDGRRPAVLAQDAGPRLARFFAAARGRPYFHYEITVRGEMRPAEHNRVVPTAERDVFGLPRLAARCVLGAATTATSRTRCARSARR